ncbi:MAG: GNAT family N-acetyltransferase [Ruminococcus sp.]|nr:GNAT family N-acetyltransferase [Ruminococcus sp.]
MEKLDISCYPGIIPYIDKTSCGAVYPLSIAEARQTGDVFIKDGSVLLHHYCGFAFIFGKCGTDFLDDVYNSFLSPESITSRRFILFTESREVRDHFLGKSNTVSGDRLFFSYPKVIEPKHFDILVQYSVREIDSELAEKIEGMVAPGFSWDSRERFLANGKGFCVTDSDIPAAWAFSAAVSSDEIDIGVETRPAYRGQGLAYAAAEQMIRYCFDNDKRPVWACDSGNTASRRLAEKLGFVKTGECFTVRRS